MLGTGRWTLDAEKGNRWLWWHCVALPNDLVSDDTRAAWTPTVKTCCHLSVPWLSQHVVAYFINTTAGQVHGWLQLWLITLYALEIRAPTGGERVKKPVHVHTTELHHG